MKREELSPSAKVIDNLVVKRKESITEKIIGIICIIAFPFNLALFFYVFSNLVFGVVFCIALIFIFPFIALYQVIDKYLLN